MVVGCVCDPTHHEGEKTADAVSSHNIYVYGASTRQLGVLMFESPNYGTLRLVEHHQPYSKAAGGG